MDRPLSMFAQDYLVGNRPLDDLQQLLMEMVWDTAIAVASDTRELVNLIDLRIAEFTSGHISESELKELIRQAAGLQPIVMTAGASLDRLPMWRSDAQTQRVAFG